MSSLEPRIPSRVNPSLTFNSKNWVVSMQNTGLPWGGHAVIVVEGVRNGQEFLGQYDIRAVSSKIEGFSDLIQYEIGNSQGYIYEIVARDSDEKEKADGARDYSQYSSKSWPDCCPEKIKHMIVSIKQERQKLKPTSEKINGLIIRLKRAKQSQDKETQEKLSKEFYSALETIPEGYKYQAAGSRRSSWLGGNKGHNCVTWCWEQLSLAGIQPEASVSDSIKAAPEISVGGCTIL